MSSDPSAPFEARVRALPQLGLGISTEFGASAGGLDVLALHRERASWPAFLEVGADLERGADATARAWAATGAPTTYHFLDLNLEDEADLEPAWIDETAALARSLGAAWLCGDAGVWHVGPRDRGHGVLQPPVLTADSADAMARNVRRLRAASGFEVLPENPPAHVYLGDLHLLEYFSRVAEGADAGLLLDVAHLAIYQRATGRDPLDGFDALACERVVEVHVAGATEFRQDGRRFVDDDHSPEPLPETWRLFEQVLARAPNLRAVVYECERNPREQVLAGFERIAGLLGAARPERVASARFRAPRAGEARAAAPAARLDRLQRTLFRMQHDARFAARLRAGHAEAASSTGLGPAEVAALAALDPVAVAADREGRRRAQLLRNASSEFRLCLAVGPDGDGDPRWLEAFASAPEFHAAVVRDGRLPLAFAAFAEDRARLASSALFRACVTLEAALARARRLDPARPPATRGPLVLAPAARLLALPAGTYDAAQRGVGAAEVTGAAALRRARIDASATEWVLLVADLRTHPRFGRLRPVRVEPLPPLVAELLRRAARGLDAGALAQFAREHEVAADELAGVVAEYRAEGVLCGGSG